MHLKNLREDFPASVVVFLVALPLCLGIAVASGAPPLSGIIAGVIGGIVVGFFSGSSLSVSGPAAGLTAVVIHALDTLDSYQMFLLAVVIAGLIQVLMGALKAGVVGYYFPNSVIKGMLAAIGLILILKQIPHGLGYHAVYEGSMEFKPSDDQNTFSEIVKALQNVHTGAAVIAVTSLFILIGTGAGRVSRLTLFKYIPGALLAVGAGVALASLFTTMPEGWKLHSAQLVDVPDLKGVKDVIGALVSPDFSALGDRRVYIVGVTIALIASIESLLSIEAADKLDPLKRITPASRELGAQGIGNILSGLLGGLPVTAVIVRSSANITAGARSKASAIMHGFLLAASLLFFSDYLRAIPLAALAAVLLYVGYKLAKPSLFIEEWKKGPDQFIPFVVTVVGILLSDLLIGISIGMVVGLGFVLKSNFHNAITLHQEGNTYILTLRKDVSFLNKARLLGIFATIPEGATLHIDVLHTTFVDHDIKQGMNEFIAAAPDRNIRVTVKGSDSVYSHLNQLP